MSAFSYTSEELEAISGFREALASIPLSPEQLLNSYLIRWLRARSLRIPEAKAMLLESLKWRKEYKADTILEEEFPTSLQTSLPIAYCGVTKEGYATFIIPVGRHDMKSCLERFGVDMVERSQVWGMELFIKMIGEDMEKQGMPKETQVLTLEILDLEGFTYSQFFSRNCLDFFMKTAPRMEANYPEFMAYTMVINAPRFFNLMFRLMKPFIHKATLEKVHVFGIGEEEKWKKVVRERFPAQNIPPYWGGSLEGDDEFCSDSKIWIGAPKPNDLRLMLKGELQIPS